MNAQNKVLAVVNGKAITEEDVQRTLINMGPRAQQYNSPQGRKILLDIYYKVSYNKTVRT